MCEYNFAAYDNDEKREKWFTVLYTIAFPVKFINETTRSTMLTLNCQHLRVYLLMVFLFCIFSLQSSLGRPFLLDASTCASKNKTMICVPINVRPDRLVSSQWAPFDTSNLSYRLVVKLDKVRNGYSFYNGAMNEV